MSGMSLDRPFICTIGDLILDVVVLPRAPLRADGDTPATITLAGGGQAANVAAWASSLGARSRLICARGNDQASEIAAAHLERRGVEICGPVLDGPGGVVVSTREPDGARTMASDPGVNAHLHASAIDPGWVEPADVLHVSGYCLLREATADAAITAAGAARRVTLDLASAHDIELFGPRRFSELVRALGPDLVFANEAERAAVPDLSVAWVVKRGARGAQFPEGPQPSVPVTAAARCVESVGAMPAYP
jgi:ribokinase